MRRVKRKGDWIILRQKEKKRRNLGSVQSLLFHMGNLAGSMAKADTLKQTHLSIKQITEEMTQIEKKFRKNRTNTDNKKQ